VGGNMSKTAEIVDVKYERIKLDNDRYKSVLFEIGGKEVWLPRSLIEIDEKDKTVALPAWKAEQEGIDGEVV
jgi:hypothetical protein